MTAKRRVIGYREARSMELGARSSRRRVRPMADRERGSVERESDETTRPPDNGTTAAAPRYR